MIMHAGKRSGLAVEDLAGYFRRNGYVRWQNEERVSREGWNAYKKGDEVRFAANSRQELAIIRRLLVQAGFKPGRPFAKGRQFRQPVYGRDDVARFWNLISAADRSVAASRRSRPRAAASSASDQGHRASPKIKRGMD
jgi:hypothetical protein